MKEKIIEIAKANGADLVGFASTDRFTADDPVFKIFPGTKTVIGLAFRVLRGVYRGVEEGTTYYQYTTMGVETIEETVMPMAQLKVAAYIEQQGFLALPQKRHQQIMAEKNSTNPEVQYDAVYRERTAEVQMDFLNAAVQCGLGEKGLHGALLTAKFGLFYHAALIVRRGDISPAEKKIGVRLPDCDDLADLPEYAPHKMEGASDMLGTWGVWGAYTDAMEIHRMATLPEGHDGSGCDRVVDLMDHIDHDPSLIVSDNGQMWRNLPKRFGGIDTPMTKVVYGKLTAGRNASAAAMSGTEVSGMKVVSKTDFGVIALSSLTEEPIETSDNMLLSTIGRARNTDQVFDGDRLVELGRPPILAEVIEATISIKTRRKDLQVWGVNAEGFYVGKLPTTVNEDGYLTFIVGEKCPACYYLIVAE